MSRLLRLYSLLDRVRELFSGKIVCMGMLSKIWSAAVRGIDGFLVSVELDLANGLPHYTTVGLPDCAVRESRERVVSALRNSGFQFPSRRVTVNLAPAQWRKRGTQFDLAVALGVLTASGQLPEGEWMGRLGLYEEWDTAQEGPSEAETVNRSEPSNVSF